MPGLSQKQKDLLFYTRYNRGEEGGEYYCELGRYKAWTTKTVNSLVEKGLVEIVSSTQSAIYIKLTQKGQEVAAPFKLDAVGIVV